MKNVILIEPYYGGSHKHWVDNIVKFSKNSINVITMPARFWKWRMKGASIYLADQVNGLTTSPDVFLCSTMMDVALFRSLLKPNLRGIPILYYMHENQLTYPDNPEEKRNEEDFHYGFSNISSCLASDKVIFNSVFHRNQFEKAALALMKRLPDYNGIDLFCKRIQESVVIGVGIDFEQIRQTSCDIKRNVTPTLLWNHRRSFDKDPELFWKLCDHLDDVGLEFNLVLLGSSDVSECFDKGVKRHSSRILISERQSSYEEYIKAISSAMFLPISSKHDFYGISFLEAVFCGLTPIMPIGYVYEEHLSFEDYSDYYYRTESEFLFSTQEILQNRRHISYLPIDFSCHNSQSTALLIDDLITTISS